MFDQSVRSNSNTASFQHISNMLVDLRILNFSRYFWNILKLLNICVLVAFNIRILEASMEQILKIMTLKPNVILVSLQQSFNKACEFQVFTPPKFCLSRRRCVAISGVTRTPEIGARIEASGCWAAIGITLRLLFLSSLWQLPTHLLGVGGKNDQNRPKLTVITGCPSVG